MRKSFVLSDEDRADILLKQLYQLKTEDEATKSFHEEREAAEKKKRDEESTS